MNLICTIKITLCLSPCYCQSSNKFYSKPKISYFDEISLSQTTRFFGVSRFATFILTCHSSFKYIIRHFFYSNVNIVSLGCFVDFMGFVRIISTLTAKLTLASNLGHVH